MTELTITPKTADKTARFKGAIAAGEHVAVTIKGGAEWLGEDNGAHLSLRVLDLVTGRTLAIFPRPPETEEADSASEPSASAAPETETAPQTDAWSTTGDDNADLYCELNLNTTRMVNAARHMLQVPVLFVMGEKDDQSDAVTRTLYFRDRYEVGFWPERIGDDTPYDLDRWPKKIDEWTDLIAEFTAQLQEMSGNINTALEVVETAISETMPAQVESEVAGQLDGKVDKDTTVTAGNIAVFVSGGNIEDSETKPTDFASATDLSSHTGNSDIHVTATQKANWTAKAEKASNPTAGNFAKLDASGNPVDSGKKWADFASAADVTSLQNADTALGGRIFALEGEDTGKSAREIAAEEVAKIVANADSDLDTLKEIADFLSDDQTAGTVAKRLSDLESGKVDVVSGKGLSTNDYTDAEKTKLAGIAAGAEVNVQSDWSQTDTTKPDYIKNKPDVVGIAAAAAAAKRGKLDLTVYQDAVGWAMASGNIAYGMFVPSGSSATAWILAEDEVDGDEWGLQFVEGMWAIANGDGGSDMVTASADAVTLTFTVSNTTYTLTRVSPLPTADTLAKTSEIPVVDGKRDLDDLLVRAAPTDTNGAKFYINGVATSEYDDDVVGWAILPNGPVVLKQVGEGSYTFKPQMDAMGEDFTLAAASNYSADVTVGGTTYHIVGAADALAKVSQLAGKETASNKVTTISAQSTDAQYPSAKCVWDALAAKQAKYHFIAATVESGALTLQDAAIQTWTPSAGASVTVGAAAYVTGAPARDMVLVIDCSLLTEGDEPTVTWGTAFHPRTDAGTDFVCAAGVRNVYYISEYAAGEFVVGGWQETAGGNA